VRDHVAHPRDREARQGEADSPGPNALGPAGSTPLYPTGAKRQT
jgi:hypothetical protein